MSNTAFNLILLQIYILFFQFLVSLLKSDKWIILFIYPFPYWMALAWWIPTKIFSQKKVQQVLHPGYENRQHLTPTSFDQNLRWDFTELVEMERIIYRWRWLKCDYLSGKNTNLQFIRVSSFSEFLGVPIYIFSCLTVVNNWKWFSLWSNVTFWKISPTTLSLSPVLVLVTIILASLIYRSDGNKPGDMIAMVTHGSTLHNSG